MPKSLYSLSPAEISQWMDEHGQKSFRTKQLIEHIYFQRQPFESISTWPASLIKEFGDEFPHDLEVETHQVSKDDTHKWLYKLHDGKFIETVLMLYPDRATVCISSQAGCAMGCTFCATGQAGFDRHLTTSEIVEQVARTCHSSPIRVSNIVFMGMGEPMANIDAVEEACTILCDQFGFSARNITVSTVGFVPGMKAMAKWELPVTLAVSLHTPFDNMRTQLVPINSRYPIHDVLAAAEEVSRSHGRRVSFEYAAIEKTNITSECANELGRILSNFEGSGGAHVNIIPLNETKNFDGTAPTLREIQKFADIVRTFGVTATIRRNRGNDIDAACGQLRERVNDQN